MADKNRILQYKILQINLGRARAATSEIREKAVRSNTDVLMVQEPYIWRKRITGWGQSIVATGCDVENVEDVISVDGILGAAVIVMNPNLTVLRLAQYCNNNCTCVEITGPLGAMYMISMYCKFSHDIDRYILHLRRILDKIGDQKVMICMDANAKSVTWHADRVDDRGEKLEELIADYDLTVVNKAGNPHTFATANGKSNIDITLATRSLAPKIYHWEVHREWTTSDHRAITIKIATKDRSSQMVRTKRFAVQRADWDEFDRLMYLRSNEMISNSNALTSPNETELLARKITNLITEVCEATMARKSKRAKPNPWWNSELTKIKRKVYKLRRARQKARLMEDRDMAEMWSNAIKADLKEKLRQYKRAITEAKKSSWEQFITREGCKNPWGITYRLARKQYTPDRALSSIRTTDNETTTTWKTTAMRLLGSLVPDDDGDDDEQQADIRRGSITPPEVADAVEFTYGEVRNAIMTLNDNKAPGIDGIEVAVFKRAAKIICDELVTLYNGCLKWSIFPEIWKTGSICALIKGTDRDETDPKSYRPICLLPVMGKTLEKLMISRLRDTLQHEEHSSSRQYGFKPNLSTEDALYKMRELVEQGNGKYVLALLFDISGAFDNVWWPDVLVALKQRNCPKNIFLLVKNYFENRKVKIIGNYNETSKTVTKGCPQGSVLGPSFWNLIFDDMLKQMENHGIETIAYADDLLVTIHGRNRKEIERAGQQAAGLVESWCKAHKLMLSKTKSEMILLKGSLDIARPPRIKIDNGQIPMKRVVRYLGVRFGKNLSINTHIKTIREKCLGIFNAFKSIARKTWGLKHRELRILYKGIFLPVATYAAVSWEDKLLKGTKIQLQRAQRQALLTVTKAYKTTSTDSLLVAAGEIPVDLMVAERCHLYKVRRGIPFTFGELSYDPANDNNGIKKRLEKEVLRQWQERWDGSTKGRET